MSENASQPWSDRPPPALALPSGRERCYVRFVALGDSATLGVGDPAVDGNWRGWARILADSIAEAHDVSFCNVATSGATTLDVHRTQLPSALGHRSHLAALIVGLNDAMRASWNAAEVRSRLIACAEALTSEGAVLMTVRFHEHARVMRLPRPLAHMLNSRVDELNEILDEIHSAHGGIRVDLSQFPEIYQARFWSPDRLHPSELGHRQLAAHFARLLHRHGLTFPAPDVGSGAPGPDCVDDGRWIFTHVVPWLGRQARDAGSALVQRAVCGTLRTLRPHGTT